MIIRSATLDELKQLPMAEPPLLTAQDATSYAIRYEYLRSNLENVVLAADFVKWTVNTQSMTENDSRWWRVRIVSSGMLPSFTCTVSLTAEGNQHEGKSAETQCEYNK